MSQDEKNHRVEAIVEALWGGPRGRGLVWAVEENTRSINALQEELREVSRLGREENEKVWLTLKGARGKGNGGIISEVEKNTAARRSIRRLVWVGITSLLANGAAFIWFALERAAGG